jgi:hypothetical protein
MEFIRKYAIAIGLGLLGIVFVVALGISLFRHPSDKGDNDVNSHKSQDQTLLKSPFARTTESLAVNYGSDIDPNGDAVKPRFKIFGLEQLPVQESVRKDLQSFLPDNVGREIIPTYPPTYIQIDPESIECDPNNNCTMDVYVDSPETFFELKMGYVNGVPSLTLTQKPWQGIEHE